MRTAFSPVKQTNTNNKVSFGTNPIYNVNLRKVSADGTERLIPARFSELTLSAEDFKLLDKIYDNWRKAAEYIDDIYDFYKFSCDCTKNLSKFFVVETLEKCKVASQRVKSIMMLNLPAHGKNNYNIGLLQSDPRLIGIDSSIKGNGEMMIYGAAKEALNKGCGLDVYSSNDSFYTHLGMKKSGLDTSKFAFDTESLRNFIKRTEEKYGISPKEAAKESLSVLI